MHTAMRLALRVAKNIRARRPALPMCFFGLYAATGSELTVTSPADAVIAGEYEPGVVAWADGQVPGPVVQLSRSEGRLPVRQLLPELGRYTRLAVAGEQRLVGSVAASRGCSHRCRHCPVPVVYDGRVRRVDEAAVLADVDQLVAAGARHISFADPDFLNAPHHSRRVVGRRPPPPPGPDLRCHHQSRAHSPLPRRPGRAGRSGLRVRGLCFRVDQRPRPWLSGQGPHRRRRVGGGDRPAPPMASRSARRGCPSPPGPPSTTSSNWSTS